MLLRTLCVIVLRTIRVVVLRVCPVLDGKILPQIYTMSNRLSTSQTLLHEASIHRRARLSPVYSPLLTSVIDELMN